MYASFAVLSMALLGGAPQAESIAVSDCLVSLIEEAQVPAQEPGVLVQVATKEGDVVQGGTVLARIDDAKTRMEVAVATSKLAVATAKATDDINIRYAMAASEVSKAEYEVSAEANRKVRGSVPQTVLNQLVLKQKETMLAIDKAKLEHTIAEHEAEVAQAEVAAAKENLNRRLVRAPTDEEAAGTPRSSGEWVVVARQRHKGEWVQPGDPVFHLVRIDRLWIEGHISAAAFNPGEIENRRVLVTVKLARGREVTVAGRVVFVKPMIEAGNRFLVRAEVQRPADGGDWPLRPGMTADMTIQLK
jgi:multidrug efflux pump subunit AcrA (membrane-fusion protein)